MSEFRRRVHAWVRRYRPIRFGADAIALLESARERARHYAHDYVGVEHVFLSAWALPAEHPAHRLIAALPVNVPEFITDLESQARIVTGRPVPEVIPQTPRLRQVLEFSKYWVKWSAGSEVQVVHILGAIAQERNSLVSHVLRRHLSAATQFDAVVGAGVFFAILTSYPEARTFDVHERRTDPLQPTAGDR